MYTDIYIISIYWGIQKEGEREEAEERKGGENIDDDDDVDNDYCYKN